jgi:hypothetical protein
LAWFERNKEEEIGSFYFERQNIDIRQWSSPALSSFWNDGDFTRELEKKGKTSVRK